MTSRVVLQTRRMTATDMAKLAIVRQHADEWLQEFGGEVRLSESQMNRALGRAAGILTIFCKWVPK